MAVVGAVLLILLWRLTCAWRRSAPRGCPAGQACDAATPEPTAPQAMAQQSSAEPSVAQQSSAELYLPCPGGGCAFDDSVYRGASECGPTCTCARCRDTMRGGAAGVRECRTLIELDDALRSADVVVLFWMAGCGPCAAFKPTFLAAASDTRTPLYTVQLADVPEVVDRFGITGFPTVLRFRGGAWHSEYTGSRTRDDFVAWVNA